MSWSAISVWAAWRRSAWYAADPDPGTAQPDCWPTRACWLTSALICCSVIVPSAVRIAGCGVPDVEAIGALPEVGEAPDDPHPEAVTARTTPAAATAATRDQRSGVTGRPLIGFRKWAPTSCV